MPRGESSHPYLDAKSLEDRFDDYKLFVGKLANKEGIAQGIIGLSTEAGELLDALKKEMYQDRPMDMLNLKEECGDVLFYLTELIDAIGSDYYEIIKINTAKLTKRYPNGYFDKECSKKRDTDAETKTMKEASDVR